MHSRLSHANSQIVTRNDPMAIPVPASTETWRPIGHGDLITAVDRQLLVLGVSIETELFAIQRAGAGVFAVPRISLDCTGEIRPSMCFRAVAERSFALEIDVA